VLPTVVPPIVPSAARGVWPDPLSLPPLLAGEGRGGGKFVSAKFRASRGTSTLRFAPTLALPRTRGGNQKPPLARPRTLRTNRLAPTNCI
jgi:hypothetical protein